MRMARTTMGRFSTLMGSSARLALSRAKKRMAMAAMRKPKSMEPVSPIKVFLSGFWLRL